MRGRGSRKGRYGLSPSEIKEQKSRRRLVQSVLALVGFVALGATSLYVGGIWSPSLGADLCPLNRDVPVETVVVLDVTDPWSALQREVLLTEFDLLRDSLPRFGRIHLFLVTDDEGRLSDPVLSRCSPGRLEDFDSVPIVGRFGATLFGNPAQLERWRGEFRAALDSAMAAVVESPAGARSPIAETIWSAGARVFERSTAGEKRMVLFSDMLQHTEGFSHYRGSSWGRDDAAGFARRAPARILQGVSVELLLVDRVASGAGSGQGRLVEFWEEWFAVQGASLTRVRRI